MWTSLIQGLVESGWNALTKVVDRTRAKVEGGRKAAGVSASHPQLKYLEVLKQIGGLESRAISISSLVYSSFSSLHCLLKYVFSI